MIVNFFTEGGYFMYAILGVSIFALACIVEKYYSLAGYFQFDDEFFESINQLVRAGDFPRAVAACQRTDHPLCGLFLQIFTYYNQDPNHIEERAAIEFQKLVPIIQKRTSYITMLGNVATLLGLLGTIYGLITSFSSLNAVSASARAEILSRGISTAMNTTAFGLMVAIPCVIAYTMLSSEENSVLQRYEAMINELTHALKTQKRQEEPRDRELYVG